MYKKASSELVVARRRRGSDNGRQNVRVAAADRVQGPLVEDDGDDAIQRDDRRVPQFVMYLIAGLRTLLLRAILGVGSVQASRPEAKGKP